MGNVPRSHFEKEPEDIWWSNKPNSNCEVVVKNTTSLDTASSVDEVTSSKELSEEHKQKLNEFQLELARKHEKRRQIMAEKRQEMEDLREEVIKLRKENQQLKEARTDYESASVTERLRKENESLKCWLDEKKKILEDSENILQKNRELRINISEMQKELQHLNTEVINFEQERQDYRTHVVALKDVIAVSKHMLQIRESQLRELKQKVESIEESLAGREMNVLSQDLRDEYERQLQNIRNLRTLYEERQRVERREKEELISQLDDTKRDLQAEKDKHSELEERITNLDNDNSMKYDEIKTLESNLGLAKAESRQYQAELAVINQLFSEILLGFNNSQDIDLDKLQKQLEEHHDLLQNIVVNEISSEVSYALPKVLLDLLNQVSTEDDSEIVSADGFPNNNQLETIEEVSESQTSSVSPQMNSAEEIIENLPKVWRILIELLSHQKAPTNNLTDEKNNENPCYKTIQTPKGPSLVLSVSQTFIRLKNLILEKKSLEKETNHLKQLNCHLENRLQDQEKRLELVHTELSKTWHVVGKLQKQHQMLHTQEKILRYELAQKRKLLTELKEELEYSREKWAQAREKNSNTEQQWKQLRTEFASRRNTVVNDELNNSVESGYSDDRECSSSDEEPGYETDISECAQKVSSVNDITEFSEIVQKIHDTAEEDNSIVNLIRNETDLESPTPLVEESASTNELDHSDLEQTKTDLVQNSSLEKTIDRTSNSSANNVATSSTTDIAEQIRTADMPKKTLEEILAQRDERLRQLESQADQLVIKVLKTAHKSIVISNKLDDLHEAHGQNSETSDDSTENTNNDVDEIDASEEVMPESSRSDNSDEVASTNIDVERIN